MHRTSSSCGSLAGGEEEFQGCLSRARPSILPHLSSRKPQAARLSDLAIDARTRRKVPALRVRMPRLARFGRDDGCGAEARISRCWTT